MKRTSPRYAVHVMDWTPKGPAPRPVVVNGLTLAAAWRKVVRFARRGVKIHGGTVARENWGMTGGTVPDSYRRAIITLAR